MTRPAMLMIGGATERMLGRLADEFDVRRPDGDVPAWIDANGADIEYVLAMFQGDVSAAMMDAMPKLKVISNFGVGYDSVDVAAAIERGIVVTHTPEVLNDEVANTAILLMLATARNLVRDEAYLRAGRWEAEGNAPLSRSVRGRTVGILGLGRIGKVIAEKLSVFGVDIVYHTRSKKDVPWRYFADLKDMAAEADILIVITPGGDATRHLVDADVLDALGPDGMLVNVARGSVVDEAALIAALKDGRLGSAALDVFEREPHVPADLIAMPNVTLLPHVASATVETRAAMGDLAVENLISFSKTGKTVTPVPECQGM